MVVMITMKSLLAIIFSAMISIIANAAAEDCPIAVALAVPLEENGDRRIVYQDRHAHFHVIVSNVSDKPQRIWQDWNLWDYYGLSFELTDAQGKKWVAKKKPTSFTRNIPVWWTLDPRQSMVVDVYFRDTVIWEGFPLPENGKQDVTMRAIFEFNPHDGSRQNRVWTGRVTSKSDKLTFYHWKPDAN